MWGTKTGLERYALHTRNACNNKKGKVCHGEENQWKTNPPHQCWHLKLPTFLSVCYTQNVLHCGFSYMYGMCFSHIHPHYLLLLPLHSCWFLPLPTSSLLLPVSWDTVSFIRHTFRSMGKRLFTGFLLSSSLYSCCVLWLQPYWVLANLI